MTFEEALIAELETISGLANQVYPVNAKEGTKPPYIVFVSSDGLYDKSLDGYRASKEVSGELNILARTYPDLKPIVAAVVQKLVSFQQRSIGTDGPYIQDISYDMPVELFESDVGWYRCNISFRIRM